MTLKEVAIIIGQPITEKQIEVYGCGMMWFTEFFGTECCEPGHMGIYACVHGRGKTRTESRKALATAISGKIIVLNPYDKTGLKRREYQMPETITGRIK